MVPAAMVPLRSIPIASKNTLHFGDQFMLANFIQAEYASSKMFDNQFAELSTNKLSFGVT